MEAGEHELRGIPQLLATVRRWAERVGVSERSLEADGGAELVETDDASATSPFSAFSEESLKKSEVVTRTGLTPGEYVVAELEEQGGRLKQQAIIEYTGWSAASVSRLLSEMEAEGHVVRFRIGRENLVCLPGSSPSNSPTGRDGKRTRRGTEGP